MDNSFLPKAISTVTEAIAADNAQEYEQALALYRKALEYFMTGLKYEKNPATKQTIMDRVEGYMKRAELLRGILDKQAEAKAGMGRGGSGGGGSATASASDAKDTGIDEEKKKLRGALAGAVVSEKPNVKWDDVAGLEAAKSALKEAVILPARFPQLFTGKRRPWKGILLYGPPGTGKSYLAKAVATESDAVFFAVSSSDLVSKWQGESEKLVRNLFELAREHPRSIIFIDEIDSMCGSRSEGENDSARRIKTEFLVQMQGVGNTHDGLLVLGATNVPWELDPAMRRRFEKRIYIPLPEAPARANMFQIHLGDTSNTLSDHNYSELGELSEGCSGSDISVITREALMEPLRKCQAAKQFIPDAQGMLTPADKYPNCPHCPMQLTSDPAGKKYPPCPKCKAVRVSLYDVPTEKLVVPDVSFADFKSALQRSGASVSPDELTRFTEWTREFGQEGS
ncbi:katanin like protein [Tribonema minus]|uniref:vesicle-fusing ATPase n=1 Tax=Tribonema minus TaxID=303371 RepID=A0A836CL36_9STRA|nr:katanin like protein [Tribonema minus]